MRGILYTDELARELLKLPRMPLCACKQYGDEIRDDRQILHTFLRSDGTCVLEYDEFVGNGELKYYKK